MANANKEAPKYFDAKSLAEDFEGAAVDVRTVDSGCFFIAWTGATATDAVVKAQESCDGSNWKDITSASITIATAAGFGIYKLTADVLKCQYFRLVIVDNTESTGTVTGGYFFKNNF
jgi:hypothetical protein